MTIGNGPMERRERLQKDGEIKEGGREGGRSRQDTLYVALIEHI